MRDCTFTDNVAGASGGAIWLMSGATLTAWNTDFVGNAAPAGADGALETDAAATLACCLTGAELWAGEVTLDDTECAVPSEPATWGGLKALYR